MGLNIIISWVNWVLGKDRCSYEFGLYHKSRFWLLVLSYKTVATALLESDCRSHTYF